MKDMGLDSARTDLLPNQGRPRHGWIGGALYLLGSGKLALLLVAGLILLSLLGAVLPQQGMVARSALEIWQKHHPLATALLGPPGFFNVFRSWPFLICVLLLGTNTLVCTIFRLVRDGGIGPLRGPGFLARTGFVVLHFSIVLLLVGAFLTASTGMHGLLLLTEGQSVHDTHDAYVRFTKGPMMLQRHNRYSLGLGKVTVTYEKERYPVDIAAVLEFSGGSDRVEKVVRVNHPVRYRGLVFTYDETGFSPRIIVKETKTGRHLVDSYVALTTHKTPEGREYRDFLPVPFFGYRPMFTLLPDHIVQDSVAVKNSDIPGRPLLVLEMQREDGSVASRTHLPSGEWTIIGDHAVLFAGLRRWASILVVEDPGYYLVYAALWLGVGGLAIRYGSEFRSWMGASKTEQPLESA